MNVVSILGGVRATVFATVAFALLIVSGTQSFRLHLAQNKLVNINLTAARETSKIISDNREIERKRVLAQSAIEKAYADLRKQNQTKGVGVLADRKSGALVLRDKFTCPRAATGATSTSGTSPGEARAELPGELEEFLVREAIRADEMTLERNELSEIAKKDRERVKP